MKGTYIIPYCDTNADKVDAHIFDTFKQLPTDIIWSIEDFMQGRTANNQQ